MRKWMFVGAFIACASVNAQDVKPNVLWILTDDHRYDSIRAFNKMLSGKEMSPLGYVESPETDKLAAMGTTFINTYCQAQGCAPSRASMHMGRYPFRSGVYQFEYFNRNTDNSYPFLPEEMVSLGYQTFHTGKLGVRVRDLKDGVAGNFDMYQTDIDAKVFEDQLISEWGKKPLVTEIDGVKLKKPMRNIQFYCDDAGKVYYISKDLEEQNPQFKGMARAAYERFDLFLKDGKTQKEEGIEFTNGVIAGESPKSAGKTRDANYTKAFISYLENPNATFNIGTEKFEGVDPSQPLFAHIGYDFPHTPVLPPADFRKRFSKKKYVVPTTSKKEFESMAKAFQKRIKSSYSDDYTDELKQKMVQDYFAFCAYGDQLVGDSVDAFIKYSENNARPWMVVYVCGDHGWKLNEHGAIEKNTPWEIDSHNPIIVVSSDKKAFPAGKVVRELTEFVDIAPTILSAAGANLASEKFDHLDGFNLEDIASKKIPARDYTIGESHHGIGPRANIRTEDYAFSVKTRPTSKRGVDMEWALDASWEELDPSLYDLKNDPNELVNLAHNPEYREVAEKMKDKLLSIVLGDKRAEVNWGTGTKAIGTEVHRSNFAPGSDNKKLKL